MNMCGGSVWLWCVLTPEIGDIFCMRPIQREHIVFKSQTACAYHVDIVSAVQTNLLFDENQINCTKMKSENKKIIIIHK